MKKYLKIIVAAFIVASFNSCSLDVQDEFKFKSETYSEEDPFDNMTAWEYIQTRTSKTPRDANNKFKLVSNTSVLNATGDELDFMIAAIKKCGFEELYNQTSTTGRTYLLLNNNAFTGNNSERDVIRTVMGVQLADNSLVEPETFFNNITPTQLNVLKAILKYHIVSDYVAQLPTIPTYNFNVLFKTMLPKVDIDALGKPIALSEEMSDICFSRSGDARYTLDVNGADSPLPATANSSNFGERVRRHHYVFNNGIGHYMNEMVRYQPYSLYTNLPVN